MFGDKVPTGVATGVAGTLMGTEVLNTVLANGVLLVPVGDYYVYAVGANITVQIQDSLGVWNNVTAAGVGGLVSSDGANVRFSNAAAANQTVKTQKLS